MNSKVNKVFLFILKYKQEHDGNSPTVREIGEACGITSTSVVDYYLNQLQRDGYIHRDTNVSRNIDVVGGQWTYNK